ncbi:MAG: nucleotidyltransferase domain-containing protein [Patescibacteria group bacterium]
MSEKAPNQNNENRFRHMPVTEPNAKERLKIFREGFKEFQKEYPEVLGAMLYGSMAKGKADGDSDIDVSIFVDAEALKDENLPKVESKIRYSPDYRRGLVYRNKFLKYLNISNYEILQYYAHLDVKLISEKIIDETINKFLLKKDDYKKWKNKFNIEKYANLNEEKKDTLMMKHEDNFCDPRAYSLFFASIGRGIEKYRHMLLKKLYDLPDRKDAENMWESIYYSVLHYEQGREETIKLNIPKTLNEAIRVFHPEFYKKISKS